MEPKIKGKAFNYNDTRDRKFYDVFVWMFHPLAKIVFKTQYIGRENVPKTGSLIIASNHRNSYDPGLIAAARVRKIHYMAKLELFNLNKLASWIQVQRTRSVHSFADWPSFCVLNMIDLNESSSILE